MGEAWRSPPELHRSPCSLPSAAGPLAPPQGPGQAEWALWLEGPLPPPLQSLSACGLTAGHWGAPAPEPHVQGEEATNSSVLEKNLCRGKEIVSAEGPLTSNPTAPYSSVNTHGEPAPRLGS